MSTVRAVATFAGSVHEAETCWYDTSGWPDWVDGLARVLSVSADWPAPGAVVVWESGPAGRGRVTERVAEHEPLSGQTNEVQDDSISARQTVSFVPSGEEVQVELALNYAIRRRTIFTPLVDLLFIRRAMTMSLRTTLERFGAQLVSGRNRR